MLCVVRSRRTAVWLGVAGLLLWGSVGNALGQVDWKKEWERSLQETKREGEIVVGIPARPELRKQLELIFKPKFGIGMELLTARGPQNASRIASEYKAGVKYFDVFIGGSGTYESLVEEGMVDPFPPNMILPEVREEKHWWGGHIWEDNVKTKRFLYSFIADAGTGGFWYNTEVAKPEEFRSLDDFLNPKWKGKVGFLDPRTPGSGQSIWSFLWDVKGEGYLRKLVQQDLFVSRDQRQLADALAKGKLAIGLGVSFYTLEGFILANLPVKELPRLKEGAPSSNGSGVIGIVKNPPHPHAAKVFVNWLLSKEGQELYVKVMHQSTRRLDVDTKWLQEYGMRAAKDVMTVEEYHKVRNHLEDKYIRVRIPSAKFAEQILK
ncbi:MAG TPA: extracellular solute-binding protein [Candidatus Udaeobacter sp.]|nr:extracellular solute-binding protein [Candidatus Udaeobacter sp.]